MTLVPGALVRKMPKLTRGWPALKALMHPHQPSVLEQELRGRTQSCGAGTGAMPSLRSPALLWELRTCCRLCLPEYPWGEMSTGRKVHCVAWFWVCVLHVGGQLRSWAFPGVSPCLPGPRRSAGLQHIGDIGRWSSRSTAWSSAPAHGLSCFCWVSTSAAFVGTQGNLRGAQRGPATTILDELFH